jgi:hypothetical protein
MRTVGEDRELGIARARGGRQLDPNSQGVVIVEFVIAEEDFSLSGPLCSPNARGLSPPSSSVTFK